MTESDGTPESPAPVTRPEEQWAASIRSLTDAEAKAALLQAMIDINEHRRLDQAGAGRGGTDAIMHDEYLASVVSRVRLQHKDATDRALSSPVYLGCAGAFALLILGILVAAIVAITGGFTLGLLIPMALVGAVVVATFLWFRTRGR